MTWTLDPEKEMPDAWKLGIVDAEEEGVHDCPFPDDTLEALDWYCGQVTYLSKNTWYSENTPFGSGLMVCVNGAHVHDLVAYTKTPDGIAYLVRMVRSYLTVYLILN